MNDVDLQTIAVHGEDGEILRVISCLPGQAPLQAGFGEAYVVVAHDVFDDTHYVQNGKAVKKTALSPTVLVNGMTATISGLPAGLTVSWEGEGGVTDTEPLEVDHDEPGTYTLHVSGGAAHLPVIIEVTLG
ncbi:MAG: hypothetical protein ACPH2J_10530 [Akkermansiaceae bacterium]